MVPRFLRDNLGVSATSPLAGTLLIAPCDSGGPVELLLGLADARRKLAVPGSREAAVAAAHGGG